MLELIKADSCENRFVILDNTGRPITSWEKVSGGKGGNRGIGKEMELNLRRYLDESAIWLR